MLCIREIYYCIFESMHIVVDNPVGGILFFTALPQFCTRISDSCVRTHFEFQGGMLSHINLNRFENHKIHLYIIINLCATKLC